MLDAVTTTNASMLPEALRKELEEIEQCGGLAYLDDVTLDAFHPSHFMFIDDESIEWLEDLIQG